MIVDIKDLIRQAGKEEQFYPGKRILKRYTVPGEFKSHCVVFDWQTDILKVELKAGLSGKNLDPKELKNYPVSYQAATYLELVAENDDDIEDEDEDETSGSKGKSGGGGKKPKQRKLEDSDLSLSAFDKATDGQVADKATIKKFVVMGKELAQEAYAQAFTNFKEQLAQTKVMAMDIMKDIGNIIQKATPGGGLEAKGNESVKYKYDVEKTSGLFGGMSPGQPRQRIIELFFQKEINQWLCKKVADFLWGMLYTKKQL